jgi:hypothetical protein
MTLEYIAEKGRLWEDLRAQASGAQPLQVSGNQEAEPHWLRQCIIAFERPDPCSDAPGQPPCPEFATRGQGSGQLATEAMSFLARQRNWGCHPILLPV